MSERVINTWRDPYDEGFSTCRLKQITIKPGRGDYNKRK